MHAMKGIQEGAGKYLGDIRVALEEKDVRVMHGILILAADHGSYAPVFGAKAVSHR